MDTENDDKTVPESELFHVLFIKKELLKLSIPIHCQFSKKTNITQLGARRRNHGGTAVDSLQEHCNAF